MTAVDVAIVGGGFAGAATAWALARAGVREVLVLERECELGVYASGRGAGIGRQLADDDHTTELTVRGASILRDELADCWSPTGGLLGFDDPAVAEVYRQRAARTGVTVSEVSRRQITAAWPIAGRLDLACGLAVPGDGVIDIARLLRRYAAAARIELGVGVTAIEAGRVHTTAGTIAAKVIVDASGAWAGQLVGAAPLDAFKRHLFVLEASAGADAPYLWHLGRREVYVRRDGDRVLASPCDAKLTTPGDHADDPAARAALADLVGDIDVARSWACVRAFTADRTMRVGRDPDRPWLVWAAGLGGHGATASAAVGERAAHAALSLL